MLTQKARYYDLPQWTALISGDDVAGEDHLGVEGAAQSYQQYLVPGIITTTDHARYYSFYCWVLYRFIYDPDSTRLLADFRGPYFKRHEVAFILGCYSHHKDEGGLAGLVGGGVNNYKARQIWDSGEPISLDAHYFQNKLGGFGQYYRPAMQTMGLVAEPERGRWVYRLTDRGRALAKAFEDSLRYTRYFKALSEEGQLTDLRHNDAIEYGEQACLCADSLGRGFDRDLLLDTFFRFDGSGVANPHLRRRLTLGLILDLVAQSGSTIFRQTMRPALYLGQYAPGQVYQPAATLRGWADRWRLVQVRHTYTSALQALWAVFLDHLRANPDVGFTFSEFTNWAFAHLTDYNMVEMPVSDYLDHLCAEIGLSPKWTEAAQDFSLACQQESQVDEITLYRQLLTSGRDPSTLMARALRVLGQLFLRFYPLHLTDDSIWQEVARRPRLPVAQYLDDFAYHLQIPGWTIGDWVKWLYRDYLVSQHEIMALQKLRQNQYNTFKFYYRDGRFFWAYNPIDYQEPLRYPSLRLYNGLTMLIDLGLIEEDDEGRCCLTDDGYSYLTRAMETGYGD